ncbi:YcnI family protein [Cryobacterium sp. SO2]|uniref:YcnI family copper-binding membrane protein n=1 Tax=Cryobacterium sp. SO2 TaxID=1897060 RepID=UPI00223DF81E|nr:YcnI family protein [Cryobacterium sp. SO2]WEO76962.1 YcnI family protein [Cryobacterium sp. SO2]
MKLSTPIFAATTLLGAGLLALSAPLAASAHVEVEPSSTAAGSYSLLTFAVSHGCDGSATTGITVDIPETITSVTPTVNPGWDVAKVAVDLATPLEDGEGDTITTRVGQVSYTAQTPLVDGLRTTFVLSLQIPEDAVGETLSFPVLQSCEVGETSWSEATVEGEAEPAHPAPSLTVTEATGEAGHGHGTTEEAEATATTTAASDDVLARVLGIGGLVVGAVGLVVAVASRRKNAA